MTMGVNCMDEIKWYIRGYKTIETLTNKVKVGKYSNKMSPSDMSRRVNCLTIGMKTDAGMRIFEGTCTDPLAVAMAFAQITMSPCEGNMINLKHLIYP